MIEALNTAANGLLRAERRATDLAVDIVETVSQQIPTSDRIQDQLDTQQDNDPGQQQQELPRRGTNLLSGDNTSLVQQVADFKGAALQIQANASVFSSLARLQDETLGKLVNEEG